MAGARGRWAGRASRWPSLRRGTGWTARSDLSTWRQADNGRCPVRSPLDLPAAKGPVIASNSTPSIPSLVPQMPIAQRQPTQAVGENKSAPALPL
jgi:hypothetical protein